MSDESRKLIVISLIITVFAVAIATVAGLQLGKSVYNNSAYVESIAPFTDDSNVSIFDNTSSESLGSSVKNDTLVEVDEPGSGITVRMTQKEFEARNNKGK